MEQLENHNQLPVEPIHKLKGEANQLKAEKYPKETKPLLFP